MKTVSLEELLEAGCHFGHQVTRQNPKAREFIFEARDGIHIIDLAKTKEGLEEAAAYIKQIAQQNGSLIVVGTKRQAQETVKEEVKRAQVAGAGNIYFVVNRWIGGTLTNSVEVTKNYKKLKDLTKLLADEDSKSTYTKRELGLFDKERAKLESFYAGIAEMQQKPTALFIIDTHNEVNAVNEARSIGVPIVGIVDTNSDPLIIDHPIPANDDAVGSIQLIVSHIMDAWIEGKKSKAEEKDTTQAENKKEEPASAKKPAEETTVKKTPAKKAGTKQNSSAKKTVKSDSKAPKKAS